MLRVFLVQCLLLHVLCLTLPSNEELRTRLHRVSARDQTGNGYFRRWSEGTRSAWNSYDHQTQRNLEGTESKRTVDESRQKHLKLMGIPDPKCDDGRTNLDLDWNGDPVSYTCYDPKKPLTVYKEITPQLECDKIAPGYWPKHICMDREIVYDSDLPTHEMHRPLWAVYGEYLYVPPQRWLHNVEHGAVVMLYHPCAEQALIDQLKAIVKSCIRKHVITASSTLPKKLPFALVAWGCRLQMNTVDVSTVVNFIKAHGRTGPEGFLTKEGQYNLTLLEKAVIPPGSDYADSNLCPTYD